MPWPPRTSSQPLSSVLRSWWPTKKGAGSAFCVDRGVRNHIVQEEKFSSSDFIRAEFRPERDAVIV